MAQYGGTALHRAAKKGYWDIVNILAGSVPINIQDELGATPLHRAARHGHKTVASALMELGADINACSKQFDLLKTLIAKWPSAQYSHSFYQDDLI